MRLRWWRHGAQAEEEPVVVASPVPGAVGYRFYRADGRLIAATAEPRVYARDLLRSDPLREDCDDD